MRNSIRKDQRYGEFYSNSNPKFNTENSNSLIRKSAKFSEAHAGSNQGSNTRRDNFLHEHSGDKFLANQVPNFSPSRSPYSGKVQHFESHIHKNSSLDSTSRSHNNPNLDNFPTSRKSQVPNRHHYNHDHDYRSNSHRHGDNSLNRNPNQNSVKDISSEFSMRIEKRYP